jgi:hypothetical protein
VAANITNQVDSGFGYFKEIKIGEGIATIDIILKIKISQLYLGVRRKGDYLTDLMRGGRVRAGAFSGGIK